VQIAVSGKRQLHSTVVEFVGYVGFLTVAKEGAMPNRKLRLNRAEQARHLISARALYAAGVDIEISEELLENSRALDITVARSLASSVFDSSRGTFYAIGVRLVAERPDTLLDCRVSTDWDDPIVLRSFDEERPVCRLGPLSYSRAEVLNQRIENGLRFDRRGDWFEGVILADGLRPIPEKYLDGAIVPFQLTFEDVFGEEIIETATLSVARTGKQRPAEQRGTGLYGPSSSSESRRLAAHGHLRRTKRHPDVPDYGDNALGVLKYVEDTERTRPEK
jgi:hypothetical protein